MVRKMWLLQLSLFYFKILWKIRFEFWVMHCTHVFSFYDHWRVMVDEIIKRLIVVWVWAVFNFVLPIANRHRQDTHTPPIYIHSLLLHNSLKLWNKMKHFRKDEIMAGEKGNGFFSYPAHSMAHPSFMERLWGGGVGFGHPLCCGLTE